MSSEIRTNLLKSRAGLSTVTLSDTGPVVTGIATFGVTTKIDGGNNVINVGTALTIGHTQGVQFHTQNLHSTGFEVNQVNASGIITASSYRGDGSQLTGISAGFSQDAEGNLVAGTNAGEDLASGGTYNILLGEDAGKQLTTQDHNVYIGKQAGENAVNTYGSNIGIGYQALQAGNQNGSVYSVAIGYQAGYYKPKFSGCTFIGYAAGAAYMSSTQTAQEQTFIGYGSGYNCKLGRSVGVGVNALYNGNYAFDSRCTAIGWQAGYNNSSGVSNTYVGARAGYTVTSGQKNTLVGKDAGAAILITGDNNIIIGNEADASASDVDNEITLGDANITKFRIPGLDFVNNAGAIGIGTDTPVATSKLDVIDGIINVGTAVTTIDTRIQFHRKNTNAMGWIGIPNWHAEGLYIYGPTSNSNEVAARYTSGAWAFFSGGVDASPRLEIKSNGTIKIPAQGSSNSAPRLSFESAVDSNHFTFSQYEDSNGTYTLLGQNIVLNGSGNTVVSDSGHKTAGIFFDARNHGALTFMTGGTNAYQQSVKIYNNRSISIGNVDNFGQYNSSTQTTSGGSALLVDITNGATSASYTTMVRLRGGASGYVHASLNLCATSDNNSGNYRGLGIYMNDEAANNEWYAGRPYSNSNQYMISYAGTVNAPYAASASTGYAKLMIQPNGNYNFSGTNTSDRDLKENITTLSGTSLDKIIQLTPKTFNFKPQTCETPEGYPSPSPQETPETKTGFIAQEVQSVIPSIVNGTDGKKDMGIDYNGLVAHLVNAIKEQQQQIEILKQDNIALRIRVTNLEDK